MGLTATVNMIAIVLLSGTVAKLTRNYQRQRKAGMKPVFDMAHFPELAGKVDASIWLGRAEPRVQGPAAVKAVMPNRALLLVPWSRLSFYRPAS
nr:alanine:cation symporter family protein [Noviherbaspirillum sp. L7-7A]